MAQLPLYLPTPSHNKSSHRRNLSIPKNRSRRKIAAFTNRKVHKRKLYCRNRRRITKKSRGTDRRNIAVICWGAEKMQRFRVFKIAAFSRRLEQNAPFFFLQPPPEHMSSNRFCLPKLMPISFFRCVSRFGGFSGKQFQDMLAISYLVLQACISFWRCFRQKWSISVFALFA